MVETPHDDSGEKSLLPSEGTSQAVQALLTGLNWIYDRAVGGLGGLAGGLGIGGAKERANAFLSTSGNCEEAIDSLIKWSIMQAGTAGFVSNVGGLITLPVAIPANLAAVSFIQLNMVATIAHLRGHDVGSYRVRTFALACLAGSGAVDLLKDVGVQVGTRIAAQTIAAIPGATLIRINQAVGFRLVTKAGATGAANLSKLIPLVGGLVSGTIDGATTLAIGKAAKSLFPAIVQVSAD